MLVCVSGCLAEVHLAAGVDYRIDPLRVCIRFDAHNEATISEGTRTDA